MKRLGRAALELLKVAEELRDAEIELDFLVGKHDPAGHGAALFAFSVAMAESERDYIRDRPLEGRQAVMRVQSNYPAGQGRWLLIRSADLAVRADEAVHAEAVLRAPRLR